MVSLHLHRPETLKSKEPVQVQFIINVLGQPALEEEFRDLPGAVRSGQIRVARRMEARLTGPADQVAITPSAPTLPAVRTVTDIAGEVDTGSPPESATMK